MIEYLIIAIAFAIMVHFRYIMEVLGIINATRIILDIEHEKNPFTPKLFSFVFFIVCTITMPFMVFYILLIDREQVLKDISGAILKSYFQLEEK